MAQQDFINAAMQAGYTPDQIQAFLQKQQPQPNTLPATPQQTEQPKNSWADWLPTAGAIVGGVAGAAVPVLGETGIGEIGGSAVGSGLGETARELIQGKKLNAGNIAGQTVLGGVGAGVGVGVGKLAGGVLGKLGEGEAINGLNLTRLQQNALKLKNGESVASTLMKHDMPGVNAEGLSSGISKVQNTFDSIAKSNNVPIDQNAFINHATRALQTLQDSSVPSDKALAPQVEEALGNVIDKMANGKVTTLAELNAERQAFDKATTASQFGSSSWGVNRTVGDILRSTAYDSADASGAVGPNGESLKTVGANLRKLYNISNIADKRVGQGNSAGVLSVSNMLLGGLGALAGAPAGPAGSIAGYAATTGARKLLTTQPVASVLSKTLTNAGEKLATPIGKGVTAGLGGAAVTGVLPVSPQGTGNNQNSNNQPNNQNALPSSPSQAFGNNSTMNNSQSQGLPAGIQPAQPPANFMAGYTINGNPISDADKNMIYQIVNYRLDPTKMTSLRNNERERIINLASQYDPTYDSSQFAVKQKLRNDYTSGTQAKTINSLNTAIGHLYTLKQAANALGNGQLPILNSGKNAINQGLGGAKVNNFNTAASAVSAEMATVFKNSGATDDEIRQWRASLNPNMSPAQLQGSIDEMIQLMGSRLQSLQNQYEQGLGVPADFSFLSPESKMILQSLEQNQGGQLPATP